MASPSINYSLEEMKAAGLLLLRRLMNTLARKGDFDPAIFIVVSRDELVDVRFDYDYMNSEAKKEALFAKVREEARRRQAKAVIVACDAFTVHYSEEERRRIREDPDYLRRYEIVALTAGSCDEIVAGGFGRKVECISITVQSPTDVVLIQQHYERAGAEKRSILFGNRVTCSTSTHNRSTWLLILSPVAVQPSTCVRNVCAGTLSATANPWSSVRLTSESTI